MKHIVIFFGPTGVGKSMLAELLAQKVPSEIVNMDMGQFYEPLSIGTAKPKWRSSSILHHLFDIIKTPRNFSVIDYRAALLPVLSEIWGRNRLPFIVGGSAFYLKSLFFPPLGPNFDNKQHAVTWDDLYAIDPLRAAAIHKNDTYRIQRAMNIWLTTGNKPSEYASRYDPISPYTLLFVTRERSELYAHIDQRVQAMIDQGWIEEVRGLLGTPWEPFLKEKKIIGYGDLFEYLLRGENIKELRDVVGRIQQKTRNYAKRQYTFWRMLNRHLKPFEVQLQESSSIASINLTLSDLDLYISQLSHQLSQLIK